MESLDQDRCHDLPPMPLEKAREILISHSKKPRNHRQLETDLFATAKNPVCGDEVTIQIQKNGSQVIDVAIQTQACTICTASASLLSEMIVNKTLPEALQISKNFQNQLTLPELITSPWPKTLGPLQALEHLKVNKTRVSCGLLPWIALDRLL